MPGQADGTRRRCSLGYGRTHAGRVGNGVGFNAYPLRTARGASASPPASTLEPAGAPRATSRRPRTTAAMEGRPLVREATLEEWRHEPRLRRRDGRGPEERRRSCGASTSTTKARSGAWPIDLNACTGCNACVVACQSENNVPVVGKDQVRRGREMHWLRIDRYFTGSARGARGAVFQPVPCMQCENAPCEQVCPVAATVHDAEGLNAMVYNRCIGTRYCSNNCPYKVRRFNFFNFTKDTPELLQAGGQPRRHGALARRDGEVHLLRAAHPARRKIDAKLAERPLADGDVQTACQQACPTQAIALRRPARPREPGRRGARQRAANYVLLAELNNKPRTTLPGALRNPHPALAAAEP